MAARRQSVDAMSTEPVAIVVMGVTGCGKTLIAKRLARALNASFIEGDRLHSSANIETMRSGIPLRDEDRAAWLDAIGQLMKAERGQGRAVVAACSALKHSYRDRLRSFVPDLSFLFLDLDQSAAERRVAARRNHFMPASLVASQFEALERPDSSERAIAVSATTSPRGIVAKALAYFAPPNAIK